MSIVRSIESARPETHLEDLTDKARVVVVSSVSVIDYDRFDFFGCLSEASLITKNTEEIVCGITVSYSKR